MPENPLASPVLTEPEFFRSEVVQTSRLRSILGRMGMHQEVVHKHDSGEMTNDALDEIAAIDTGTDMPPQLNSGDRRVWRLVDGYNDGPKLAEPLYRKPGTYVDAYTEVAAVHPRWGESVNLPVANFVYAAGLEDWTGAGRYKGGVGVRAVASKKVIREYASRPTPMPPVGIVFAYTQPNGLTFYKLVQDGAHRLAAAKARGDKTIPVQGQIVACRVDRDYIPLPNKAAN